MKTFYQCDPELFWSCKHTLCQKECTLTTFEKYAKRDEFGRAIVACIDDLFEPTEEVRIRNERFIYTRDNSRNV